MHALSINNAAEDATGKRLAPKSPTPKAPGSVAGSDFSVGPSASQLGSPVMPSLTTAALAALQKQTRTASEVSKSKAASSVASGLERGSLLHTLKYEGAGFWLTTTSGKVWCSAKGPRRLDLYQVCNASLLPEGVEKAPYCNLARGCRHLLPKRFEVVHSSSVIAAADLISGGADEAKGADKPKAKGKEKGKKGKGKGAGKGKGTKRKAKADAEDVGDD